MKKLALLVLALSILWPQPSRANQAEIMMLPTRVVMENSDRYATVVIKNTGQATGNFTADMVDMEMKEDGVVAPLEKGNTSEFSAIPYVHMSPSSFTLKPGESQNVRILLRKREGLPPGEYRSHLRVRLANDDVEGTQAEAASAAAGKKTKEAAIAVKANLVLVIPIIFRHGETTLAMKIESPKLSRDASGKSVLNLYLAREGTRSSMGDITVNYIPSHGQPQLVASFPGVPVYRPTPRRMVSIPLDIPKGASLADGAFDIVYKAQEKEGGRQLAEAKLPLGR